jgi:hypothetical protein
VTNATDHTPWWANVLISFILLSFFGVVSLVIAWNDYNRKKLENESIPFSGLVEGIERHQWKRKGGGLTYSYDLRVGYDTRRFDGPTRCHFIQSYRAGGPDTPPVFRLGDEVQVIASRHGCGEEFLKGEAAGYPGDFAHWQIKV